MSRFKILVHEVCFGREIVVEALFRDPRTRHDGIYAGSRNAVVVKQHHGGL